MGNGTHGEICGWHYATRQPVRLRWRESRITEIEEIKSPPAEEVWIAPTLFDLQINGYGGLDFQQDDLSVEELLSAARQLRAAGCGRFLVTLITDEWSRLTARLRHLRSLRSRSDELHAAITGWHIEGPFLSAEPGFHGAHDPALMRDPTPDHILELRAITGTDPVLLTLSPERPGALPAIELAVSRGMKVSLGHTNASAEILHQAVQAGATGFTHLGNGCPRKLDRHDNILWRVLETSGLEVSLIPDQIHVSPPLFRLVHRVLGADAVYYTTDAMSAAGMPPGRFKLGKMELEVGADQIVRQPGEPLFAGSALQPIEGVFHAAQMLGCCWQEVWRRFSEVPAKLMGLRNDLAPGQPADFCVLKVAEENRFSEVQAYLVRRPMNQSRTICFGKSGQSRD
jgi:N-acetylglucosamine-6-phosphate deacetylase